MAQRSSLIEEIKKYRGVIFDFDETLVDLAVDWEGLKIALSKTYKRHTNLDIPFTPIDTVLNDIRDTKGYDLYNELLQLITTYEVKEEKYRFNVELIEFIQKNTEQKIAIYSMNTFPTIKNFIDKYLVYKPDIIISKELATEPKPTHKDILKIITAWQLEKKDVVYIGNSAYNDGKSGEMAGIKTLIINFKL